MGAAGDTIKEVQHFVFRQLPRKRTGVILLPLSRSPQTPCLSRPHYPRRPVRMPEGDVWNLGRKLPLIWAATSPPSADGRSTRGCRSIVSFTTSSGRSTLTPQNWTHGGTNERLRTQGALQMRVRGQ